MRMIYIKNFMKNYSYKLILQVRLILQITKIALIYARINERK